jgi:short-subunit dehydrogenase
MRCAYTHALSNKPTRTIFSDKIALVTGVASLRLGEALHRELKRDGITVTALCPGMSDTGFATAAQQKITSALKLLMMQPAPVVRAGIRALHAGRMSVVPGLANKAMVIFSWATPRWFHQAIFFRAMNA